MGDEEDEHGQEDDGSDSPVGAGQGDHGRPDNMVEVSYYERIKPEDIWIFPKVSSQKQRRYYDKENLFNTITTNITYDLQVL